MRFKKKKKMQSLNSYSNCTFFIKEKGLIVFIK